MKKSNTATRRQHRVLIATDGSRTAQAALATAAKFPWPEAVQVRAIVARTSWLPANSEPARLAGEASFAAVVTAARSALVRRWPESKVVVVDAPPADAILAEAQRFKASLIVLGWRGHGVFHRLLAGSVSRGVAERAPCPVLVVREAVGSVRRFVVGFDGCANSERALDFLGSLEPVRGSRVILVNVVELAFAPPSIGRLPASIRSHIRGEVAAINDERQQQGQATVAAGAARLERSGWTIQTEVRAGAPLASLSAAVAEHRADVLVLGARATSGIDRVLLGSVANGALNSLPVVLLVH